MAPSLSNRAQEFQNGLAQDEKPSSIILEGSKFLANGHPILTQVPCNIIATPSPFISKDLTNNVVGCFLGFDADEPRSCHVVPIGKLRGIRFMSIFRFKVWWTTHWTGDSGRDVEHETQLMILDKTDFGRPYVLLLPLIEGPFRASLQSGVDDNLDICVESGSTKIQELRYRSCVYMHAGVDPFRLVKDAMQVIRVHLGTFKLLEEKCPPKIVDKFGWCTWDAFYLKVHPQGVWDGVKGLVEGGCPPGMVLIDDGWQSICHDDDSIADQESMNRTTADYSSLKLPSNQGMGSFISDLKNEFKSVEHVYVWHALCGYWGGVRPNVPQMPDCRLIRPKLSKGLQMTMEDLAVDKIVNNGVGLVLPDKAHELFEGMHSYLQSAGIDGVKVDVIHLLEMLSEDYGGRVELAKAYYKALTSSIRKHFQGNGVIASMEHCNDFMFLGTETIALGRVGDDFWCTDPSGDPNGAFWLQGCHMVHCAYNSLWMGNFIHPDWDMFQSTHPCAEFHAASRAISGGPIYVSDSVGKHDFQLLKRLVLPDGTILRCQYYALPTRDCLFEDPLHDGKTMLKIWNLNKYTGVLGAFNCQGGGWCPATRRNKSRSECSVNVTCLVSPNDIEWSNGKTPISLNGVDFFVIYNYKNKKLELLKASDNLRISLPPFEYELFVVSPVYVLTRKMVRLAPIGLVNMLNTGGAIESCEYIENASLMQVGVKGMGEMRIFASSKPLSCTIDGVKIEFDYRDNMVIVQVPWPNSSKTCVIEYVF
ncbi:Galactinol--sucrose galactosyltransferase [Handroanthus impetiginosus]|uniref:galactinol--sucrose galactosyltransferase n=1 Tax=Handroanthus impetiginosus TaxID=429701 RepID=A0A2G9HUJ6_9LAMI|nr:Galactinol--sucrose galactosyltransferase [Handroanthus impetiginosus]